MPHLEQQISLAGSVGDTDTVSSHDTLAEFFPGFAM